LNNQTKKEKLKAPQGAIKSPEEILVEEVIADFKNRQSQRKNLERGWQLNMNFLRGNQYCDLNSVGEIEEDANQYFWQQKRVFNYVAPTIETRLAKLSRTRPALAVRAASQEEADINSAKLASSILFSVAETQDLDAILSEATMWSETCGTAFYKIVWDSASGKRVGVTENGENILEGDVKVISVSPFEIYPYSLYVEKLEEQPSIIHAKALPVQDIALLYGVELVGKDLNDFGVTPNFLVNNTRLSAAEKTENNCGFELVIERYSRPNLQNPNGRLTVVAGKTLLFDGELPYLNGEGEDRTYPFVKQTCLPVAGSFFGLSVIDRLIPVQRAYNAVKNRKHEFLNRISMGSIAVEDGSVDCEELAEDGFAPGKIIVYRQGGKAPEMLALGSVPAEFSEEEESLQQEFAKISGTGELSQRASGFTGVTSATGLQLIIEQDDARLNNSYQQIKRALKQIGKHILRIYRQFASDLRLMKCAGDKGELKLFYFKGSDISSDDVVLEADTDANLLPAQKRNVIYELIDRGLFNDDKGVLSETAKGKILEYLGYGGFGYKRDISRMHADRAGEENIALKSGEVGVKDYDDHAVHIEEHTAFLLSEKLSLEEEERVRLHILNHKNKLKEDKN